MDLTDLPIEIVLYIANYLSGVDISHCCAVSITWHHVFDSDIFWKKRCSKKCVEYLKKAECMVEPHFNISSFLPMSECRANFLRETHLLGNWRSGRFQREEIEFDFDESMYHDIEVEFFDNDHVLVYKTYRPFHTEVWNVTNCPDLRLTIPFVRINWHTNVYKCGENKVVVIQQNLVQVFNICLQSESFSRAFVLFFNKPEEFSTAITEDTDVNELLDENTFRVDLGVDHVVCGDYLVGVAISSANLVKPTIHIWNIQSGKKLKEWDLVLPKPCNYVTLLASETSDDKVIVLFDLYPTENKTINVLIDLPNLVFLQNSFSNRKCITVRNTVLCDTFLCVLRGSNVDIFDLSCDSGTTQFKYDSVPFKTIQLTYPISIHVFNGALLVANKITEEDDDNEEFEEDIEEFDENRRLQVLNSNTSLFVGNTNVEFSVNSTSCKPLGSLEIIPGRFLAFHDKYFNLLHIWEMNRDVRSVVSFPEDAGSYRAVNEACTRIAIECANKVFIYTFW